MGMPHQPDGKEEALDGLDETKQPDDQEGSGDEMTIYADDE